MKKLNLVLILLLIFVGVAFASDVDVQKHPSCIYCGMDRGKFAHSRMLIGYDDGTSMGACSLHCAAVDLANRFAPEHLEIMTARPREVAAGVRHAGSIFLGAWSMEALGDYAAGPNHTLPTAGTARFSSPLGVMDFMKFTNIIECSRPASVRLAPVVELLARAEGFHGHAASAALRRDAR